MQSVGILALKFGESQPILASFLHIRLLLNQLVVVSNEGFWLTTLDFINEILQLKDLALVNHTGLSKSLDEEAGSESYPLHGAEVLEYDDLGLAFRVVRHFIINLRMIKKIETALEPIVQSIIRID